MRRLLLLGCLVSWGALASDHWVLFKAGSFEVFSSAGPQAARETLVRFEQFRHALGQALGDDNLETPLPVRILLFKSGAPGTSEPVIRGRDRYDIVLTAGSPPPQVFARLTKLFLEVNTARMPERLERGLVELFSTIEVSGIRITLGRPPADPDLDWARVHLLTVDPEYYGKLRVLTYNLRNGVDEDAAFRNAVGKSPEEIEREAQRHLAGAHFETVPAPPRAMGAKDFPERSVEPDAARLMLADLLLGDESRTAYQELVAQKKHVPESYEGLGMLAARAHQPDEARRNFAAAMEAGSKSADCYMEYARLTPNNAADNAKALVALERAAKLNPKLAEPHFLMAQRQTDAQKRIAQLKLAAKLDGRNARYWEALAEASLAVQDFPQAAKAWRSAEQAAATPGERSRFARERLAVESHRLDWEDVEKRRKTEEAQREIEKLKAQARADLRALEARANSTQMPGSPTEKAVPWSDLPQPSGVARGVLKQVDCLGKRFRLIVESDDGNTLKLLIANPSQIAIAGGGELTLGCGPQRRRRIKVEYFPKANAKLGTAGEVATIDFE